MIVMKERIAWVMVVSVLLLAWSGPAWSATIEVSANTALTDNSEYDRNPSIILAVLDEGRRYEHVRRSRQL
jgi:hypothetical protein